MTISELSVHHYKCLVSVNIIIHSKRLKLSQCKKSTLRQKTCKLSVFCESHLTLKVLGYFQPPPPGEVFT